MKKIKILNLNAWLLPLRLSVHNNKRINRIFEIIKEKDPDIITFQEVWDASYLDQFARLLSDYFLLCRPNWIFNKSGLMTFTKFRVVSNKLHYFKPTSKYNFFEKKAKKGFLVTRINFYGKQIDIVNAHLHEHIPWLPERNVAELQFEEMENVLKKAKKPAIICGDLNLPFKDVERLKTVVKLPNKKSEVTLTTKNHYCNKGLNKTFVPRRQLDYVMYIENGIKMSVKINVLKKERVSDHLPIYAEVLISER